MTSLPKMLRSGELADDFSFGAFIASLRYLSALELGPLDEVHKAERFRIERLTI